MGKYTDGPEGYIEHRRTSAGVQPLVAIGYPKVGSDFGKVDTDFLAEAMGTVDEGHDAFFSANCDHVFPGHVRRGVGDNGVDDGDYLAFSDLSAVFRDGEHVVFEALDMCVEGFEDCLVRCWKSKLEGGEHGVWARVCNIVHYTAGGTPGCRCCPGR